MTLALSCCCGSFPPTTTCPAASSRRSGQTGSAAQRADVQGRLHCFFLVDIVHLKLHNEQTEVSAFRLERHYCCQAGRLPGVCALHHFTKWRTLYCAVESAVLFPVANSRHFLLRHMFVLLNQVLRWPPKLSNRFVYNSDFNAEEGAVLVQ